ncbi:hypothetical protein GCM10015535_36080 [Streptomyces gelaticus]|uniref:Uncharacterized protein n=1 Tax=Streptomyces gelaticus TaxID=285446 RepID=A0ABQ2W2E9_9ACTN|nr:hypothetical protein [Streptomyces gelaticus]GGV87070.1 hypothetical protein GCM10015535_36080 [Streptomyces gelaticus]
MTDTKAFSFGANERSWWAESMDPQVQAERRALAEGKAQLVARMTEEQRLQELTKFTGPGLVAIIKTYEAQNIPAVTTQVQGEFQEAFPGANFRENLEVLKREGIVYELTSSTQGFMGARTTHLHLM